LKRERYSAEIATIESYVREVDQFIKKNPRSQHIFANVATGTEKVPDEWRDFRSEKEREKADTGDNLNENAYVWLRGGKVVGVNFTFQSPSRDWAHFVIYYYRPDGTLAKIDAQLNTFYGNITVIREKYYSGTGKLLKESTKFFDLKTQKKRKPSKNFEDEELPLYMKTFDLPFRHLL
jgi:hypothetical protein